MLSSGGEVIYVGKSKQIGTRLLNYFRCEFPEEKGGLIRFNVAMMRHARH